MVKKSLKDLDVPGKVLIKWISILMVLSMVLNILFPHYIPGWIVMAWVGAFDLMSIYIILYLIFKSKAKEFWVIILNLLVAMMIITTVGFSFYSF